MKYAAFVFSELKILLVNIKILYGLHTSQIYITNISGFDFRENNQ